MVQFSLHYSIIIAMNALSRNVKVGLPWELFYSDDLVLLADSLVELKDRLNGMWMECMDAKGLREKRQTL